MDLKACATCLTYSIKPPAVFINSSRTTTVASLRSLLVLVVASSHISSQPPHCMGSKQKVDFPRLLALDLMQVLLMLHTDQWMSSCRYDIHVT